MPTASRLPAWDSEHERWGVGMPTTFIRDRILEVASRQPVPDPNRPSITRGRKREEPTEEETHFWIFVELTKPPASPDFYVVPEWWIENDIHRANGDYLAKHGGQRAITKDSTQPRDQEVPHRRVARPLGSARPVHRGLTTIFVRWSIELIDLKYGARALRCQGLSFENTPSFGRFVGFVRGRRRIRTSVGIAGDFTDRSLWPLGHPPVGPQDSERAQSPAVQSSTGE
jgi:hypothetical protein